MEKSQPLISSEVDDESQDTHFTVSFTKDNLIRESPYNRIYKGIRVKDKKQVAIITWKHLPPPLDLTEEVKFSIPKA